MRSVRIDVKGGMKMTIGVNTEKLKELRIINGYTQTGLARVLGLHPMTIQSIERGVRHPYPTTAKKIADKLGVKFEDIFFIQTA